MGVLYRADQFRRILTARPLPPNIREEVAGLLSAAQLALFEQCPPADQWHGYRVLSNLRAAGHHHPDLLVAALLHDVGKARHRLSLWDRTLIVLAQTLFPRRTAAWGQGNPRGWKRPFVIKREHPDWGAEMAQAVGCSPLVVWLIRHHQDKNPANREASKEGQLLALLQWADDQN